jgi:hypothetical protein
MQIPFFPKKQLLFRTVLSEAEVLAKLAIHLQQSEAGAIAWPNKTFVGEIKGAGFFIYERVGYRGNSFSPGISGTVGRDEHGTVIKVVLRLGGCVQIFILVWCYVPLLLLFLSLVAFIKNGEILSSMILIPIAALAFMFAMTYFGFKSGTETARAFMTETFESETVEEVK